MQLILNKDFLCVVPWVPAVLQWSYLTDAASLRSIKPRTYSVIKQQNHPKMITQSEIPPIERENVRQKNRNKHLWRKTHNELNIYGTAEEKGKQRPISNLAPIHICGPTFHFSS